MEQSVVIFLCVVFALMVYVCSIVAFFIFSCRHRKLFDDEDVGILVSAFWPLVLITWFILDVMNKTIKRGN
jgi:hypothetical protein